MKKPNLPLIQRVIRITYRVFSRIDFILKNYPNTNKNQQKHSIIKSRIQCYHQFAHRNISFIN
ncbi:hypothetical protein [uncultured Gammaproteobacteria bacterium]|nr:hypothetical protein [uncultured Gammaproteobacteria bacterium]CAC9957958.1 hypothetical protein [uncultured Gammaproteobacteria bacterium]CAC9964977.1 hypothetical protein [uncultured Gammaproteobacteria bacterium]CAC9980938.1 hypothetical protein [uncultured Gammaproteobacteria bacterium]